MYHKVTVRYHMQVVMIWIRISELPHQVEFGGWVFDKLAVKISLFSLNYTCMVSQLRRQYNIAIKSMKYLDFEA